MWGSPVECFFGGSWRLEDRLEGSTLGFVSGTIVTARTYHVDMKPLHNRGRHGLFVSLGSEREGPNVGE